MREVSVAPARAIVDTAIGSLCTACVVLVESRGARDVYAAGTLCPDPSAGTDGPCSAGSVFDLASLTKLATTAVCLALVRERVIELEMPMCEIVPGFRGGLPLPDNGQDNDPLRAYLSVLRRERMLYRRAAASEGQEQCYRYDGFFHWALRAEGLIIIWPAPSITANFSGTSRAILPAREDASPATVAVRVILPLVNEP